MQELANKTTLVSFTTLSSLPPVHESSYYRCQRNCTNRPVIELVTASLTTVLLLQMLFTNEVMTSSDA